MRSGKTDSVESDERGNVLHYFGAWMDRESARYQEILTGMGLLKK